MTTNVGQNPDVDHDDGLGRTPGVSMNPGVAEAAASNAEHDEIVEAGHKRLFGRGLLYVLVWSLQIVASSIVSPFLAHLVTPLEFGALASAMAIYQALSVAALLGIDEALVLQRADDDHDPEDTSSRGLVTVAMALAAAVTILALVSLPLWAPAVGLGGNELLVGVVILWTFPSAAAMVMISLLVAQDRLGAFMAVGMLSAVLGSVVGLILLLTVTDSVVAYAFGTVICQFIAVGIGVYLVRPNLYAFRHREVIRRAFKLGIPLAFGNLAFFVLNAGDRIIVQRDLGSIEVARYQVAYVIGSVVLLMLNYTTSAWSPQFAALKNGTARMLLAMRSRDELYRLLVPIILAVTLVSPLALRILAPSTFSPTGLTMVVYIVALTAFPVAAGGSTGRLLIVGRRAKTVGIGSAIAAALNIVLNIVLVPVMGINGAALSTLVSYSFLSVLSWAFLPERKEWRGPSLRLRVSMGAIILISGLSMLIPETDFWNVVKAIVAVCCAPWFVYRLLSARRGARTPEPGSGSADDAVAPEEASVSAAATTAGRPDARSGAFDTDTRLDTRPDADVDQTDLDRLEGLFDETDRSPRL